MRGGVPDQASQHALIEGNAHVRFFNNVHVVGNHCIVRAGESPTVGCAELVVSSQAVVWWGSCGTSDTVYPCVRVVFFSSFIGLFVFPVLSVTNKETL